MIAKIEQSFAIALGIFVGIPFALLSVAWMTVLPAIGLLWIIGWLK